MSTRNRTPSSGLSKNPPSKPTSKFELPALSVGGFGSLTDGTDIPPPEREPTPPPYINPANVPLPPSSSASQVNGNGVGNGTASATGRKPSQISIAGTDQTGTRPGTPEGMLSPVMSPTSPNRPPSSMKRFLSRKSMNENYNGSANGRNGSTDHTNSSPAHGLQAHPPSRPESSLSFVSQGGTKTKKKRSWWQKLMGKEEKEEVRNGGKGGVNGANGTPMARKRTSTVLEQQEPKEQPTKKGPPPPTLPQLRGVSREGKADGSFGGDDMFSNIK